MSRVRKWRKYPSGYKMTEIPLVGGNWRNDPCPLSLVRHVTLGWSDATPMTRLATGAAIRGCHFGYEGIALIEKRRGKRVGKKRSMMLGCPSWPLNIESWSVRGMLPRKPRKRSVGGLVLESLGESVGGLSVDGTRLPKLPSESRFSVSTGFAFRKPCKW